MRFKSPGATITMGSVGAIRLKGKLIIGNSTENSPFSCYKQRIHTFGYIDEKSIISTFISIKYEHNIIVLIIIKMIMVRNGWRSVMNLVRCKHSNHDVMLILSRCFHFSHSVVLWSSLRSILSPFFNCWFPFLSLSLINNALLFLCRCGLASRCSSRASISTKVTPYQSVRQCNSIWIISTRFPLWTPLRCLVYIPMQT